MIPEKWVIEIGVDGDGDFVESVKKGNKLISFLFGIIAK
jgi:hypothetical protein